jgi:hypothetical protein
VIGASSFLAQILNEQLHLNHHPARRADRAPEAPAPLIASLLKVPTDYGLLCLVFLLIGSTQSFMVAYGLLFVSSTGYFVLACGKWFHEMRSLDRSAQS